MPTYSGKDIMDISKARIRGLPRSVGKAISSANLIFSEFGPKEGTKKLFAIAFKDVNYRQYDFREELLSARRGIDQINNYSDSKVTNLDSYFQMEGLAPRLSAAEALQKFFVGYGSDKGNSLSLPLLYTSIIERISSKSESITLLEIGLGTNNVDVESNMGVSGKPGASIRSFREFLRPPDRVIGADVDARVLFQSPGLETYFVDQLNRDSLLNLGSQVGEVDLIIDDGLHILESNVNTVLTLFSYLKVGGYMVVEDISDLPENLMAWQALSLKFNSSKVKSNVVRIENSVLFILQR